MRKLALFLTICMAVSVFVSCAKTDAGETEPTVTEIGVNVTNSASSSPKITRDDISSVIYGMVRKVSAKDGSTGSLVLPSYLSYDFVKELSTDNYVTYKKDYSNYVDTAIAAIEDLICTLPDNCILSHNPTWIINFSGEVKRYIIPDPSVIPEDAGDDLVLYLECTYYEARYDGEYDVYYDEDMEQLREKYADIDMVLIDRGLTWLYLDVENGTLETIELFPGYSEVKDAYYDIIDNKMSVDHGEKVTEIK